MSASEQGSGPRNKRPTPDDIAPRRGGPDRAPRDDARDIWRVGALGLGTVLVTGCGGGGAAERPGDEAPRGVYRGVTTDYRSDRADSAPPSSSPEG